MDSSGERIPAGRHPYTIPSNVMVRLFGGMENSDTILIFTFNYIFSTFLWPKNAWRRNPSLTLYLIGGVFFFEISLFSKSLTRLPQAQITANVCSLTQPKMAFKYLNLLIIRNQLTVHSNRSLSKGLQTIWGAKTDVSEIWTTNVNQVLEVSI